MGPIELRFVGCYLVVLVLRRRDLVLPVPVSKTICNFDRPDGRGLCAAREIESVRKETARFEFWADLIASRHYRLPASSGELKCAVWESVRNGRT